jgi:hypothetical protein
LILLGIIRRSENDRPAIKKSHAMNAFDADAHALALLRLAAHLLIFLALAVAGAAVSWFAEATEREAAADAMRLLRRIHKPERKE